MNTICYTDFLASDILATDILATNILATDILATDVLDSDILATDILATDILAMADQSDWLRGLLARNQQIYQTAEERMDGLVNFLRPFYEGLIITFIEIPKMSSF